MREKDEEVAKVDETTQDSDRKVPEENAVLGELNFNFNWVEEKTAIKSRLVHLPPSLETLSISSSEPITFLSLPSSLQELTLGTNELTIMDRNPTSSLRVLNFSGITFLSSVLFLSLCCLPFANEY